MDRNSAISGGTDASDGYYDVDYTWEKAVAGRNTIRKTTMVLPEGSTLTYEYLSTSSLHDADASRVTRVKVSTTAVATYAYNGVGQLVGTSLPQPDVFMTLYDPADLDDYDRLDNFSRVTQSKWTRDLATDKDFYHTSITWDRNSNVTVIEDNIHGGLDVAYTNDNVNRLTKAEEGTWNGSSITSRTREQNWTLDQVGNWEIAKLDLDGDNNWNETGEYNDDRTHNVVNELTARDTDDNGTDNFTLTYDNVGNLTDDGEAYEYVYDVWGRLRKVLNTSTQALIEEFWYNGLGFRITFHADATGNGTTDASDPKYHLIYDERWRHVATYRADDDNPKEAFVSHQAGLDGGGSSSYIDSVILRQRDANSGWVNAADGTMEERRNYCQNWRSDVSALLTSAGVMVEWGKFTAYGLPIGLPAGDIDSDFITDTGDVDAIKTWVAAYDVRADLDLDGDIDATDGTLAEGYEGWQLGWNELSHADVANRLGYAGYHKDVNLDHYHVRHRVLEPHLGRWTRRDPLGYVDGMSLYEYVQNASIIRTDPMGRAWHRCGISHCNNSRSPWTSGASGGLSPYIIPPRLPGVPIFAPFVPYISPFVEYPCKVNAPGHPNFSSACADRCNEKLKAGQTWCDEQGNKHCCICILQIHDFQHPKAAPAIAWCALMHEMCHMKQDCLPDLPKKELEALKACNEVPCHDAEIACLEAAKVICNGEPKCLEDIDFRIDMLKLDRDRYEVICNSIAQ